MVISKSIAVPPRPDKDRALDTPEMIDRMAADLRARSDADLPHSFYVEQVRQQLAGQASNTSSASHEGAPAKTQPGQAHPSVFHAWALSE